MCVCVCVYEGERKREKRRREEGRGQQLIIREVGTPTCGGGGAHRVSSRPSLAHGGVQLFVESGLDPIPAKIYDKY